MGETISKPVKWIGNKLYKLGQVIEHFFDGGFMPALRSLLSSQDVLFPPISYVLTMNERPDLMDSLNNALQYKNTKAIIHIGNMLSDLGLDHIVIAFKKAVEENMVCRRCGKEIKFIDELCYCPEDSGQKCHHGTTCCDNRKIKAVTNSR